MSMFLLCLLGGFCIGCAIILLIVVIDFMFFMPARILHISALHAAEQYRKLRESHDH